MGVIHCWRKGLHLSCFRYPGFPSIWKQIEHNRDRLKRTYIEEKREGSLESEQKWTWEGGVLACVYVRFFKKNLRFSKWPFILILQFFLLTIMTVWNVKQTVMKDYNIQSCQSMACDYFRQPHNLSNVGSVKKNYLQPLVIGWISM